MSKAAEPAGLQPPNRGHNYEPAQRAEYILAYYLRRKATDDAREEQNKVHKTRVKADTAFIHGLDIDKEDADPGYEKWLVNNAIENAEGDKERQRLAAKRDLKAANQAECSVAAGSGQQLDFHDVIAKGQKAKEVLSQYDGKGKVTVSGGKNAGGGK